MLLLVDVLSVLVDLLVLVEVLLLVDVLLVLVDRLVLVVLVREGVKVLEVRAVVAEVMVDDTLEELVVVDSTMSGRSRIHWSKTCWVLSIGS